jgi:hypothetical protein
MSRSERPIVFPNIEPLEAGMLDVGDSQQIHWECRAIRLDGRSFTCMAAWVRLSAEQPALF